MSTQTINYEKVAASIVASHTTYRRADGTTYQSYDAIYFDRGFSETNDEVLSLYIAGDERWREEAYDTLDEWADESVFMDARTMRAEWEKEQDILPDGYEDIDLDHAIAEELQSVCDQDYCAEWVQNMKPPLIRFPLDGGDDPDFIDMDVGEVDAEQMLRRIHAEPTEENMKAMRSIIAEAYYAGAYRTMYGIINADMSTFAERGDRVRIKGEVMVWATNPYAGDGFAEVITLDVSVPRNQMSTDDGAPGYSSDEVFGWYKPALPIPEIAIYD